MSNVEAFSECDPKLRAALVAACGGDAVNAAGLYEGITREVYDSAVLAERGRCLSLVQLSRAVGGTDSEVIDRAMSDVDAGTPGVPPTVMRQLHAQQVPLGSSVLLQKKQRERTTIEPN